VPSLTYLNLTAIPKNNRQHIEEQFIKEQVSMCLYYDSLLEFL